MRRLLRVAGPYWNSDRKRKARGVLMQVGVYALIVVMSIGVTAAHLLVKGRLQRDCLTDRKIGRWLETGRRYRLLFTKGDHDNPDQRIADGIRVATDTAVTLICKPCTWTIL